MRGVLPRYDRFHISKSFRRVVVKQNLCRNTSLRVNKLIGISNGPIRLRGYFRSIRGVSLPCETFTSDSVIYESFSRM